MEFPQQFPYLVIPTGAGPGQNRILINFDQSGIIQVIGSDGSELDLTASAGQANIFFYPAPGEASWAPALVGTSIAGGGHPSLDISSPATTQPGATRSAIHFQGGSNASPGTNAILMATDRLNVAALCQLGNMVAGSVSITPSAANVPTSVTVSFTNPFTTLSGTTFFGFASADNQTIGTSILGVAVTNATATGCKVWLTRNSTAAATVNYFVIGV